MLVLGARSTVGGLVLMLVPLDGNADWGSTSANRTGSNANARTGNLI